jgi:hypothetical protein
MSADRLIVLVMYYVCVLSAKKLIKIVVFKGNVTESTIFVNYAVAQLVEELFHKLEGRGLDS